MHFSSQNCVKLVLPLITKIICTNHHIKMSQRKNSFQAPRPPVILPFERPGSRTLFQHDTNRSRSRDPINRGVLSDKVPISFTPQGITVHSIPSKTLEKEEKVGLYSELERLSMVNYELKKQNEALASELHENRAFAVRGPEMEATIHRLQQELLSKEAAINSHIEDQTQLRLDRLNLSRLEPAYNELLEHNQALIGEIGGLENHLKDLLQEKDILEANYESAKLLERTFDEVNRRNDLLKTELIDKGREIADIRNRLQELKSREIALCDEIDQYKDLSAQQVREREALLNQMDNLERLQEERIAQLRAKAEGEKERDRTELTDKFTVDLMLKEEQLIQARRQIKDLEGRLQELNTEIDHLRERNLTKSAEIDTLKIQMKRLEEEKLDIKRQGEINTAGEVEKKLSQQKSQHDGVVLQLRKEISELELQKAQLKQRENEIEVLRAQSYNNERLWEMRLQHTVENELKSASSRFEHERKLLEVEISSNRERIASLEGQIEFFNGEVDRLNDIHAKKIVEITDLQRKLGNQEIQARLDLEDQRTQLELEKKQALDDISRELERIHSERLDEIRECQSALEDKVLKLIEENNKLSGQADDQQKEIEAHVLKIRVMEDVHKQQIDETEKRSALIHKVNADKELSSVSLKHKEERLDLEGKIAQQNFDIERLRNELQLQVEEINHMRQVLRDRDLEVQQEKRKYVELELQRTRDINEIREQFESYRRANVEANTLQIRAEAEKTSLNSQLAQYKEKNSELEKRLILFITENEKMREIYNEKANELEGMKLKYKDLEEIAYNERSDLENEIEVLKRSNLNNKEVTLRYSSEKVQYENQIKQLKTVNENGKQELEKLYELMNQRKKDHDHYVKQNEDLKKEVERLSRIIRESDHDTSFKRDKFEGMERTISDLERDKNLYKSQAERLNTQLQLTYEQLQDKMQELDVSKQKYDESVKTLSTQIDKDLMLKMSGINTSPEKKYYGGGGNNSFSG